LASLQLRNVPTNSVTQVEPPADVDYNGLRFAPDGNYFYFVRSDPGNDELQFLYRAPLLGGVPEKLAEDIDSNVTFSPDGRKAAFMRFDNPTPGQYQLIVKDLQTGVEKALVSGPQKQQLNYPAWSPDGKVIMCFIVQPQGALTGLDVIDAQSGQRKPFYRSQHVINHPEWLPDGNGVLVLSADASSNYTRPQVARVSYPEGVITPVTRDAGDYSVISVARTVPMLAAVVREARWNIEILHRTGEKIDDQPPVVRGVEGLYPSWTPDGKLISDKEARLYTVDPKSGTQAEFGTNPGVPEFEPFACRDGRVVFVSYEEATKEVSVWSLDASGGNRKKLTNGMLDYYPQCSTDMRWIYYRDETTDLIMRVPIDGGTPQKISDLQAPNQFDISPDGSVALFPTVSHAEGHKERLVEVSVDNGQVKREIPMQKSHTGRIQYAPDGKAIEYVVRENGVDNLWRQPLDGSAGKFETSYTSEHIGQFRWSPDEKRLALVRGHTDSDIVLIRDQKAGARD